MLSENEKLQLKKLLRELSIKGKHTELVTVYIPAGYNLHEMVSTLRNEQSTASNIKSKAVRKNVMAALDKIIQHLSYYKKTPDNGLAVFCGNVSDKEGVSDIKLWATEPAEPLRTKLYWCSQEFDLRPLEEMVAEKEIYGMICIDRSEGDVALLRGKKLESLFHSESIVPGKSRAGGQCLALGTKVLDGRRWVPIERLEDCVHSMDFATLNLTESRIIDKWNVRKKALCISAETGEEIICSSDHLFFTGPSNTIPAEELRPGSAVMRINNGKPAATKISRVKRLDRSMSMVDISVENGNFVANGLLVHNSSARFARVREGLKQDWFKQVAEAANKIFGEHPEVLGIMVSGPGPTKEEFLKAELLHADVKKKILGTVDTSYTGETGLNETVERGQELIRESAVVKERNLLQRFFTELQKPGGLAVYGIKETEDALRKGIVDMLIISEKAHYPELSREKDLEEFFAETAERFGTKIVVVSTDTREGQQFLAFGGIGGFLRYRG